MQIAYSPPPPLGISKVHSNVHYSIADDFIGVEESVQHSTRLRLYITGDTATHDEQHMAAAARCRRPDRICPSYSALTSEDPADGGLSTATSAASGQSSSIDIGSIIHDYGLTNRSIGCLGNDECNGTHGHRAGTGGSAAATSHPRAAAVGAITITGATTSTKSTSCISCFPTYSVHAGSGTTTFTSASCCTTDG